MALILMTLSDLETFLDFHALWNIALTMICSQINWKVHRACTFKCFVETRTSEGNRQSRIL